MSEPIELPGEDGQLNETGGSDDDFEPEYIPVEDLLPNPPRRRQHVNEEDVIELSSDDDDDVRVVRQAVENRIVNERRVVMIEENNEVEAIVIEAEDEDEAIVIDSEDEVEEIGDESDTEMEVLRRADPADVMNAFNAVFGNMDEVVEVAQQPKYEEDTRDEEGDDDDDIIIEEVAPLTNQEKSEMFKKKATDLLSWFKKLKHEYLEDFKTAGSSYLTEYVTENPEWDIEKCKGIATDFKETGLLDGLAVKWGLENNEVLIASICLGILEVNNEIDIDFGILCDGRIDEWNFEKCEKFLEFSSTKTTDEFGPLKFMQFTITSPVSAILLLTHYLMLKNGHPCRFETTSYINDDMFQYDPFEISQQIMSTASKYWHEEKVNGKFQNQVARELSEFFHGIDAASVEMKEHFEHTVTLQKEIYAITKDQVPKFKCPKRLHLLNLTAPERKSYMIARDGLDKLRVELAEATKAALEVYKEKSEAEQCLILKPGDFCLARTQPNDEAELVFAKTVQLVNPTTYKVRLLHSDQVVECDIRDLALTGHGLCNPVFNTFGDVGLRVAVCVTSTKGQYGKKTSWLTGTTGGRRISHRGDTLVFLDNGEDMYITAPIKPGDPGYRTVTEKPEGTNISYQEVLNRMKAAKVAVMVSQPIDGEGKLEKNLAFTWIRSFNRSQFIKDFMKAFPEWRLLRTTVGTRTVLTSMLDKRKRLVEVIANDRAFAIVRYVDGINCTAYPCVDPSHMHQDEAIFRGSHRFDGAAQKREMLTANNNLSRHKKHQVACQFEPSDMERSMPQRNNLQPVVTKRIVGAKRVAEKADNQSKAEIEERKRKQVLFEKLLIPTPVLPPRENIAIHPVCGPDCLLKMDADPYDERFHRNSPLHTPLLCGWRRLRYTMHTGKKRAIFKKQVVYFAPCGRPFRQLSEVSEYLSETRSQLTIDCFSFDELIETEIYVTVQEKYVKMADLSRGVEGIPIPVVNSVDEDGPPMIEYSKRRFPYDQSVDVSSINQEFCSGCSCEGDCSDPKTCECQKLSYEATERLPRFLRYDNRDPVVPHYTNRLLDNKIITGLYECNDKCKCKRKACHNRVVQNNIKYPMQIFKTAQSGWGCRALTDIPDGAFVCTYVGALLTNDLAENLQNDDQYFADLDLKDAYEMAKIREDHDTDFGFVEDSEDNYSDEEEGTSKNDKTVRHRNGATNVKSSTRKTRQSRKEEKVNDTEFANAEEEVSEEREKEEDAVQENKEEEVVFNWDEYFEKSALYVVDAKLRGNLGRFLNHSCAPNTYVQHVMYDTHDLRLPWVAFFTSKLVKAGDELTWDYQYTQLNTENARLTCNCGAENCRRRLL